MPIDRAVALRQAEKLVRQGKLDQAIAEYFTVVEDQPRDWNTANLLGDLLVRAGRHDDAIEQFARCADTLRTEGFLPKAAALCKKILKLRPQDDRTLLQASELASAQGLLADARSFLRTAADGRRSRGDDRGVLEIVVRLGMLDKTDIQARIAGARGRLDLGDAPSAVRELIDLAEWLVAEGRDADALTPLREIVRIEPGHTQASAELARILVSQGDLAGAAEYLPTGRAGASPGVEIVAAEASILAGDNATALDTIDRLLDGDAEAASELVVSLAVTLAPDLPEPAFHALERVVDRAAAREDWARAVSALQAFVSISTGHLPALARLVDVCLDAGMDEGGVDAQVMLAEAYLGAGAAAEARLVAEDLVRRQPSVAAHVERLRRALQQAGDPTPDATAAEWVAEVTGTADEHVGSSEPEPPAGGTPPGPHAIDVETFLRGGQPAAPAAAPASVEEDLSVALDDIKPRAPLVPPSAATPPSAASPRDIDDVFRHLREEVQRRPAAEAAEVSFQRGKALYDAGSFHECIEPLRLAARMPTLRHGAAMLLADAFRSEKQVDAAVEWLGHAADAPVRERVDRYAALLKLADLLESTGESDRALAVYLELQAEAGDYADVSARVARLAGGG